MMDDRFASQVFVLLILVAVMACVMQVLGVR